MVYFRLMNPKYAVNIIAGMEIMIGFFTLTSLIAGFFLDTTQKPANIWVFVLITSSISIAIGAGLLMRREFVRSALIFFSGYVIITKLMIYGGLLSFNGEILTFFPDALKNGVSIAYHLAVIAALSPPAVKNEFSNAR